MVSISAQVSLYPLREAELKSVIDNAWEIFHRYDLDVHPGPMSTLITGDDEPIFAALQEIFRMADNSGDVVMVTTFSNACPVLRESRKHEADATENKSDAVTFHPIGYVQNQFDASNSGEQIRAGESRIFLDPDLVAGLQGLTLGEQIIVFFYFDRTDDFELIQHPHGDRERPQRGVFTLHSPRRPNPVGATVVEVLSIDGNVITVRGLDAFNNTPVLDLKPL